MVRPSPNEYGHQAEFFSGWCFVAAARQVAVPLVPMPNRGPGNEGLDTPADRAAAERLAQGLPATIEDPLACRDLANMLRRFACTAH